MFSFGSNRPEIKKKIQELSDITLIIDDFNETASSRVSERQLQILTEIVQASSDAGQVLLDSDMNTDQSSLPHLIVTAEKLFGSCSFLNRLYLVEMDEMLPEKLWTDLENLKHKNEMLIFMIDFMKYVSISYSRLSQEIKEDYNGFLMIAKKHHGFNSSSLNRINHTEALQFTLLKILSKYFDFKQLNFTLREKVYQISSDCIRKCISDLKSVINEKIDKANKMQYLPTLSNIVYLGIDQTDDFLTYSENEYIDSLSGKIHTTSVKIGFCVHDGYISFKPKHMCKLIANELDIDEIPVKALSKELNEYSLRTYHQTKKQVADGVQKKDTSMLT